MRKRREEIRATLKVLENWFHESQENDNSLEELRALEYRIHWLRECLNAEDEHAFEQCLLKALSGPIFDVGKDGHVGPGT